MGKIVHEQMRNSIYAPRYINCVGTNVHFQNKHCSRDVYKTKCDVISINM